MFLKIPKAYFRQVGFKIVVAYIVLFITSSLLLFGSTYFLFTRSLERRDRAIIQSKLNECITLYQSEGVEGMKSDFAHNPRREGGHFLVRIIDDRNNLLFFNIPELWLKESQDNIVKEIYDVPLLDGWRRLSTGAEEDDDDVEILTQKMDHFIVQVGYSTNARDDLVERFLRVFVFISLPILLLGAIGGVLFSRKVLAPIRDLVSTIHVVEAGNLTARVDVSSTGDELAELGRLFNLMLDRIQLLIRSMRESLDNVAHDLRTPISRLRASAEIALCHPENRAALERALQDSMESSEEILILLNTMMDISEVEAGTISLDLRSIPVLEIFERVKDLYLYVAEEKAIRLDLFADPEILLTVDRTRFTQAIANLVDNSLKYCESGATVILRAVQMSGVVTITVEDNGPGIAESEHSRIWERLYRCDSSRSKKGMGLGLSLVRSIILAHNGMISVESSPGNGTSFVIQMKI